MNSNFFRRAFLKRLAISTSAAVFAGLLGTSSWASQFPARPVTLIVPFGAGGATDSIVRHLADQASRKLGQPVVVENRPGAAGILGVNRLVTAAPDGYTLSIVPESVYRFPHLQTTLYDPAKDFTYIIHLSGYALGIAVNAKSPFKSWNEVVKEAKKRPGQISYGTTGINGTMHVTVEEMAQASGIKLNHVPYKGEAEIIAALMGGHIDLGVTAGSIAPMVEEGRARVLVTWTSKRVPKWPDVPTLKEVGLDVVSNSPFGIAGPKGIDPASVKILHDAFHFALNTKEIQDLLENLNQESAYLNSEDYEAFAKERYKHTKIQLENLGLIGAK